MVIVLAAAAGVSALATFYTLAAALAAVVTVAGAVWLAVRLYHRVFRRVGRFLDDWNGEVARPGVDARPGVMERISSQDKLLSEHTALLSEIQHEVNYNHGGSLKDKVNDLSTDLSSLHKKMDEHIESTS